MSEMNEKEIENSFEKISRFEPRPEILKRDLDRTRQSLTELTQNPKIPGNKIWRIIMKNRITKIAAAVIFATLLVSMSYGTANVVRTVISGNSQISEILYDLPFSVPGQIKDVQIETIEARGEVFVAQSPAEDNNHELIVTFDDGSVGGPDWYDVIVNVTPSQATKKLSIHIRAYIDGTSNLVFQDNTVYWHNLQWQPPGKHDGNNFPTYINGIEWTPQWPEVEVVETNAENRGELLSEILQDLPFSIPKEPVDIQIEIIEAREKVSISQYPSEDNDYELIIAFDDGLQGGPYWYDVIVNVTPTQEGSTEKTSIHIKAYIDGVSNLIFCDNYVYWHNLEWKVPGQHGGNNFPTYINDIEWIPQWENIAQAIRENIILENIEKQNSEIYTLPFTLPKEPAEVEVETIEARGDVIVTQLPTENNDYELIVTFDDGLPGGAVWYDVVINVTPIEMSKKLSIHVKAYIDGISNLVFQDNRVHWSHLQWEKPGLHDGNNFPTYINDIEWTPQWIETDK